MGRLKSVFYVFMRKILKRLVYNFGDYCNFIKLKFKEIFLDTLKYLYNRFQYST